jgi:hypothetical protein
VRSGSSKWIEHQRRRFDHLGHCRASRAHQQAWVDQAVADHDHDRGHDK